MPQTSPERRARWPGGLEQAIGFLRSRGYALRRDWHWDPPKSASEPTLEEKDALLYLIEEWDFGGLHPACEVSK